MTHEEACKAMGLTLEGANAMGVNLDELVKLAETKPAPAPVPKTKAPVPKAPPTTTLDDQLARLTKKASGFSYVDKDGNVIQHFETWPDWVEDHDARFREHANDTAKEVGRFVAKQVKPLITRIEELERRVAQKIYRGQWEEGTQYDEGNMVTLGGSCWHANCDTTTRPSTDNPAWSLAVKRGRDGKRGE